MKKRMRIKWLPVLASAISISLIAACSNDDSASTSNSASSANSASTNKSSESVKIKVWYPLNGNQSAVIKSMSEIPMVQEWQKKSNVTFDWIHPSGTSTNDYIQQLGVMLASNDLPDTMIMQWTLLPGGIAKLYNDGAIIKLNDLIDKYAPNLKKIMAENPSVAKQIKADNGDILTLPNLTYGEYGKYRTFSGLIIRQDWLDELGLKSPETIDEWETVLTAFKEKKGAQAPFELNKDSVISSNDFAGAFGVGGMNSFYLDGSTVKFGPMEPAFKPYLSIMQSWYKNGLIDPDFATNDGKTMTTKVTTGKAGAFYGFIGGSIGSVLPAMQATDPKANLTATQYPVLKKGDEPKFIPASYEYSGTGVVITKANKHPEEAVKAFDYLFSQDGAMLKNFGIDGQTYTKVNGQPVYTDLILKNPDKLPIAQAMGKYFAANFPFVGANDDRYNDQYYQLQQQKDAVKTYAKYANNAYTVLMPPVSLTPEESKETGKIMNDVNTYLNEIVVKIVMGAASVSEFDKAIEQLKKMNIDRAIQIQQAALDRYNKR
ncbi:extracellular solute-binding protein [Paenibacillus qinlingensis]|uniref:extracellular solute-binding protein n=1 Tax=Paenibacillus qinlingensis TaxID=1837343 RepID=UPI0015631D75|nr:extracellular solute-binding protein [Paenibacillus qinlingensis]NQX63336.1 extracellular solute-binding protein [Paenibacillus qinlingensis]